MCGFIGSVTNKQISESLLDSCNNRIECRGPDEKRVLSNKTFGTEQKFHNFIFNRLSIIDLSENASQPMFSKQFNTLMMFNGDLISRELSIDDLSIFFNIISFKKNLWSVSIRDFHPYFLLSKKISSKLLKLLIFNNFKSFSSL